jgi:hypothetical protein
MKDEKRGSISLTLLFITITVEMLNRIGIVFYEIRLLKLNLVERKMIKKELKSKFSFSLHH